MGEVGEGTRYGFVVSSVVILLTHYCSSAYLIEETERFAILDQFLLVDSFQTVAALLLPTIKQTGFSVRHRRRRRVSRSGTRARLRVDPMQKYSPGLFADDDSMKASLRERRKY